MLLYHAGHTYEVIEYGYSWESARHTAEMWGGRLARIDNAAENTAVFNYLKKASAKWAEKYTADDGGGAHYVWIGASDIAKEGSWKWSDGSKLTYKNWGVGGEPDNYNDQDAAAIALTDWPYGKAGQWNDIDVTNWLYALVEYDGLLGTAGNDTITGGSLAETISGGEGADILKGNGGNDHIHGGAGNDILEGNGGNDRLIGDVGADKLHGGAGNDILQGGGGSDRLTGGMGADKLYGGAGKDTFVFNSTRESTVTATGRDTIFDFDGKNGDRIDLRGIDANIKVKGDQAFTFIETRKFTKAAGELRYEKKASGSYLYGDTNGDGTADFAIHFDDTPSFAKGFFLF